MNSQPYLELENYQKIPFAERYEEIKTNECIYKNEEISSNKPCYFCAEKREEKKSSEFCICATEVSSFFQTIHNKKEEIIDGILAFNKYVSKCDGNNKTTIDRLSADFLKIFNSEAYIQLASSDGKKDQTFDKQDLMNLNKFLQMFTVKKINDSLTLNMLDMSEVSKHINLKRIIALCNHKSRIPENENSEEWAEIHSNLLKYYYQYNLKKHFYFHNRLHTSDLPVTHPLFRHKISIINKKSIKDAFSFSEDIQNEENLDKGLDKMVDFLKEFLDESLPNLSYKLWPLKNDHPPPIMVLKIIKFLLKYCLLSSEHMGKIIDLLMDKKTTLLNLEELYEQELKSINPELSPSKRPLIATDNLNRWSKVFMKYRQYFAEIATLITISKIDKNMYDIFKTSQEISITFEEENQNGDSQRNKESYLSLSKKELSDLEVLKNKVNFDKLGIFEEEQDKNLSLILLGYVISNPLSPPNRYTKKTKDLMKIVLSLFSNVNDIYLNPLKQMPSNFKEILQCGESEFSEKNDLIKEILEFKEICIKNYLYQHNSSMDLIDGGLRSLDLIAKIKSSSINKLILQDILFENNFIWILLNLVLNYDKEFQKNGDLYKNTGELLDFCIKKHLHFQNIMMQSHILKFLDKHRIELNKIGVSLACCAFRENPSFMIQNQKYLNLFISYKDECKKSRKKFPDEKEYFKSLAEFYKLISNYLDEKNYIHFQMVPEYDIICLDHMMSSEYKEEEALCCEKMIRIMKENKSSELEDAHLNTFKQIIKIISKSSSKRCTRKNNVNLRDQFPLSSIKDIIKMTNEDYEFKTNAFRLYRNIYVFSEDNIFGDEEKICNLLTKERKKENLEENKSHDERKNILLFLEEEFMGYAIKLKKQVLYDKGEFKSSFLEYGVTMLISTIKYLCKEEINKRLMSTKNVNMKEKELTKEILFRIFENMKEYKEIWLKQFTIHPKHLKENKICSEDKIQEDDHHKYIEIMNWCELFSSGLDKNKYNIYNSSASKDMVKRFSNKLEDRQASVQMPFLILKNMLILEKEKKNPKENFGLFVGALYESFKLRKLSTFSSVKKNYEDGSNENVFMRILNDSYEANNDLAKNLCKFLINELGKDTIIPSISHIRKLSESKKRNSLLEKVGLYILNENDNEGNFELGEKNNKYMLLEISLNISLHATKAFQESVYEILSSNKDKKDNGTKLLDNLWNELLSNFSFSYNRQRQDRVWKECFMRTIMLIKFHQYLCEDNNETFKRIFNEIEVNMLLKEHKEYGKMIDSKNRYLQITQILEKLWHLNDWGMKKFDLIKRAYMFPLVQALFEFFTESMCGPYFDNQNLIMNHINLRQLSNFLQTFEPEIQNKLENKFESSDKLSKASQSRGWDKKISIDNVNVEMNELKITICDFLLTCCEGNSKEILQIQLKKISYQEILETTIRLTKILIFEYYEKGETQLIKKYKAMKRIYKKNGFLRKDQNMFLKMALKLFRYLNILAEENYSLKHLLQNKEKMAEKEIEESQNILFFYFNRFLNNKIRLKNQRIQDEKIEPKEKEDGLCLRFLRKFTKRLEILIEDPKDNQKLINEFIYFEPNPKFALLSDDTKYDFIEKIDRSSHESKIHGLIGACRAFEEEISIAEGIKKKHPKISSWFATFRVYEIALFFICCIINVIMVVDYTDQENLPDTVAKVLIKILAIIECVFSGVCFIIWMWIRNPIENHLNVLKYCESKGCKIKDIEIITHISIFFETIFNDNFVRVLILHLICCVLGLTIPSTGFFAIDVFSIVNLFATFKYLAKSISLHWHQLLFTFFMVLIFIYIYSVFSHLYFKENFEDLGGVCNGLIECYFAILNTAFTNGSGIGGMQKSESMKSNNYGKYFGYVFIDLMFFITVNCISLNLVFGIIVDTFGELRESNEKFDEDNKNFCFVCQLNRYDYEKKGQRFIIHVQKEHNLWNYANFIIDMINKTEKDCNGLEAKIVKKIQDGDISWIPFAKEDSDDTLKNMERKMNEIKETLKENSLKLATLLKINEQK